MPHSVYIQTGSRLHFGPLTNGRHRDRLFGGIGMMIGWPEIQVTLSLAEEDAVHSPAPLEQKVFEYRDRYRDQVATSDNSPVAIAVEADASLHSGLGTGTQLAMGIAHGLDYLYGHQHPLDQLAKFVGRGRRSALGVHGFQRGGFLVDGGKRQESDLGTLVAHQTVSPDWRILLITPPETQGLSGEAEEQAFAELDDMPLDVTSRLCQLVLMEILPALQESDFAALSSAIYEYGAIVGDYFAPVQGGRYANERMRNLVDWLRNHGIQGVGQSSWGPTIFAFCEGAAQASHLKSEILLQPEYADCRMEIVQPLNSGARVVPTNEVSALSD
ncbi:MAG: beta-RFAP synthase [Planctomycetaceae bacterium]|nr:beta-RFAP synthase [Planctomycetaceae bacterium]